MSSLSDLYSPVHKTCGVCGETKPANTYYFPEDKSKLDGLHANCKACRNLSSEQKKVAALQEELDRLHDTLSASSMMLLRQMMDDESPSTNIPHAATLMEDAVGVFGGSRGLAQHIMAEYLSARPGSMIRQKYITMLADLVKKASMERWVEQPLDSMTDDNLERLVREKRELLRRKLMVADADLHESEPDPDG